MRDVRFSFYDVKIVPKIRTIEPHEITTCHAIFSFYCATEREAKRKALQVMSDSENWKVEGCWKI